MSSAYYPYSSTGSYPSAANYNNYAAPGTPPGSWGSVETDPSMGYYGQQQYNPYAAQQAQHQHQQQQYSQYSLNPGASPFAPPATQQSTHGPSTSTPTSSGKRMNNPYACAVAPSEDSLTDDSFTTPTMMTPQPSMGSVSPVSPMIQQMPNAWSGSGVHQAPAAPLPTQLPQRDNAMVHGRHRHHGPHQGQATQGPVVPQNQPVTHDDVTAQAGTYTELARTANGSSFIQAAVREGSDPANLAFIWSELEPAFADLLLDAHGCYVIKSVLERLPPMDLQRAVSIIANDTQLIFSMCTHSLHTRRVVQFLLDSMDCPFILQLLTVYCAEVATTQQGCIVMQRAMDVATGPDRSALFSAIYSNLVRFSMDPFANYVVQHLLEIGDKVTNTAMFRQAFLDHVIELSCNKFASNVMEKALFHLDESVQHELLVVIYSSGDDTLFHMLQDSFGNYLIQSSIALANYKDVVFMSDKLRPVLQRTPYGHKIEARLDRRLKGKPVGTRSPMIGATFKDQQQQQQGRRNQHRHGSNRPGSSGSSTDESREQEEPW